MENKKLSAREIAQLRNAAQIERQTVENVKKYLDDVAKTGERDAKMERLIINRKVFKEVEKLLQAYTAYNHSVARRAITLGYEAQALLLETEGDFDSLKMQMLSYFNLTYATEVQVVERNYAIRQKLSSEAEKLLIKKALESQDAKSPALANMKEYVKTYPLANEAFFVERFLSAVYGRDSFLDGLAACVRQYISSQPHRLEKEAEENLFKYGTKQLIWHYIKSTPQMLHSEKLLEEYGDEDVVKSYYHRYPELKP